MSDKADGLGLNNKDKDLMLLLLISKSILLKHWANS